MKKTVFRLILPLLFFVFLINGASAQIPGINKQLEPSSDLPTVEDLTPTETRDLLSRLSDQEVREILLKQLDASSAKNTTTDANKKSFVKLVSNTFLTVFLSISDAIISAPKVSAGLYTGFSNFVQKHEWSGVGIFAGVLAFGLVLGYVAEICVNQVARRWRNQIKQVQEDASLQDTLKLLGLRLVLDMAGLVAFFIVATIVGEILMPASLAGATDLLVSNLIVFPRLISAFGRFTLAPDRPDLRMIYTDDKTAKLLQKSMIGLAFLLGFVNWVVLFLDNNGVPIGEIRIGFWLILAFYLLLAITAYHTRDGLSMMMAGKPEGETSKVETWISKSYPWFVIAMTVFTWFLVEALFAQKAWHLLDGRAEITLFILLLAPATDTLIRGLVKYRVKPMRGEGILAKAAYQSTKYCYFRIGRVVTFGLAILIISGLWDIDFSRLAAAGVGARAAAALFQFLLIVAFGYLVWELVSLWINRKLAAEMTEAGIDLNSEEPGGGEGGGVGSSRLSTVLPLVRFTLQAAIIIITLLVALGEIGIEIAPLLAGAGIIGLAVGFGAQKLVADVVSGIFFLVDDAFRAGEYVEIAGTFGTVEKISLRSLQLRHHKGPVHTIPYGEIPKITNFSRDWVIMKLRFTVPFDTDLNKVKKLFKKIGADMMQIPEYAEDFMQPFKSQGVLEVNDVGIVVRGKFMAKPGKQFTLRKEIYGRVQKAFDANGIQFARKEVRVKIDGNPENLSEEDKLAISAAASDAAETAEAKAAPAKK